jgi:hypothetical protein
MQKIRTFRRNALAMSGHAPLKIRQFRNARSTSFQPGDVTTSRNSRPKKRTVLASAIATLRPPDGPPRIRELRLPGGDACGAAVRAAGFPRGPSETTGRSAGTSPGTP